MMTIKQQGGIFGRNPTFNNLDVDGLTNFNDTVRIAKSSGTLLELYDADGGQDASTFSVTNGGRDLSIFAPQDIIFDQDGAETARFRDGGGLCFNGDTAAANALDDYEEGTFTPVVADAASGGNEAAGGTFNGQYTKIGRTVFVMIEASNVDTTGMTGTGDVYILGLPFTAASLAGNQRAVGSIWGSLLAISSSTPNLTPSIDDNTGHIRIVEYGDGLGTDYFMVNQISSGTSDIFINITYIAA